MNVHNVLNWYPTRDKFYEKFLTIQKNFSNELRKLQKREDIFLGELEVKNPYEYAFDPYCYYVRKFLPNPVPVLFVGMNPGPTGMGRYGVPFGDIWFVVNWLRIKGIVRRMGRQGKSVDVRLRNSLAEKRNASGCRFWGLMQDLCGTPKQFFRNCFVYDYCPLMFCEKGTNVALESIWKTNRKRLEVECNLFLIQVVLELQCKYVIAVGDYVSDRVKEILPQFDKQGVSCPTLVTIPCPSPNNYQSDEQWSYATKEILRNVTKNDEKELQRCFPLL